MEIVGKKLVLRPFNKDDLIPLYILASDPEVTKYMTWSYYKSVKDAEESLKGPLSAKECYAITLKKTGELIGNISLMIGENLLFSIPIFEASIGCWLGQKYWGKHYIREAYKLIENRARELGIRKIYWVYDLANERSKKAALRQGFIESSYKGKAKNGNGVLRDTGIAEKILS